MKTKEELNALKEEIEALDKKFAELTGNDLEQVAGGIEGGEGDLELKINEELIREYMESLFRILQKGSGKQDVFKGIVESRIENSCLTPKQKNKLRRIMMDYYQALK